MSESNRGVRGPNTYNENFNDVLRKAFNNEPGGLFLKTKLNHMTNDQAVHLFGADKRSLQRELNRWKIKLLSKKVGVAGTLKNLELFCSITGATPNDILLTSCSAGLDRDINDEPAYVDYLSLDSIKRIICYLREKKLKNAPEFILPIRYYPAECLCLFMGITQEETTSIGRRTIVEFATNAWEPKGHLSEVDYQGFFSEPIGVSIDVDYIEIKRSLDLQIANRNCDVPVDPQKEWQDRLAISLNDVFSEAESKVLGCREESSRNIKDGVIPEWIFEQMIPSDTLYRMLNSRIEKEKTSIDNRVANARR